VRHGRVQALVAPVRLADAAQRQQRQRQ